MCVPKFRINLLPSLSGQNLKAHGEKKVWLENVEALVLLSP
jgi:hypothetical protein